MDSFASFCLSGDRKKAKNNAQNWVNYSSDGSPSFSLCSSFLFQGLQSGEDCLTARKES